MMSVYFCYENKCGGETIATTSLIQALTHRLKITSDRLDPLPTFSFVGFMCWQWGSLINWLIRINRQPRTDWVYVTTYPALAAAAFLKPLKKYHICFHYHGNRLPPKPSLDNKYFHKWLRFASSRFLHLTGLKKTDLIIVPSILWGKFLTSQFPEVSGFNIQVIPNGVHIGTHKILRKKNLSPFKHVLYVGRLHPQKQLLKLISTIKILNSQGLKVDLTLAVLSPQNVDEVAYFQHVSDQINSDPHIKIFVDSPQLASLYRRADLVVLLSTMENFPLVLLESFAAGVPFASTAAGETARILHLVDKCLVLKPTSLPNQIAALLHLPKPIFRRIVHRQLAFAKHHSWSEIAPKIMANLTKFSRPF